ncbi:hypothetical protein QQ020_01255 [Fulvivirgaceae bacterium BMA12]|uniref:Lipoprotein n=1 Tax=Agaribacillus aureus TaxID=3051825 RepID=A0ABT8KZ01_9BACT|nr:hypothetical protein [Fulvivirgaceae bacterium BMA12]
MRLANIFTTVLLGIIILFSSCDTDTLEPNSSRLGFDFFPLEKGLFRTYDVEDIQYSVLSIDTLRYQLREQVVDSFLNQEDDYTYIIHRFSRVNENQSWGLDSVWTARQTPRQAISTENNVSFIKLIFPVNENAAWDGNALNVNQGDEYVIQDLFNPKTYKEKEVRTVTVLQEDEEDLLIKDERKEIFAEHIGLAEKTFIKLEFCDDSDCFGQKVIERGRALRLVLIDYGKE